MNQLVRVKTAPSQSLIELIAAMNDKYGTAKWAFDLATTLSEDNIAGRRGLESLVDEAEECIAEPEFAALAADLKLWCAPASVKQIKQEIAGLVACFPTKDEGVSAFTAIVIEEIAGERPTYLNLAFACRELRRTMKFRPSLCEILQALGKKHWPYSYLGKIPRLPVYVERVKQLLQRREQTKLIEHQQRVAFEVGDRQSLAMTEEGQ